MDRETPIAIRGKVIIEALLDKSSLRGVESYQKSFIPAMMTTMPPQSIASGVLLPKTSAAPAVTSLTSSPMSGSSSPNMIGASPPRMIPCSTGTSPPSHLIGGEQRLLKKKICQVCGEPGSGNFFGAMVCLPCKTFFIRCSSEEVSTFRCRREGDCEITGPNRSRCKYCRYQQCVAVGMVRKERPEQIEACEGQQLCVVCGDVANGIHFGVMSCEGCKKFFRRGLQESDAYICKSTQRCVINPRTRNECRYCRFQKCLNVGMSRDAIKMGRPRKNIRDYPMGDGGGSPTSVSPTATRHRHYEPHFSPGFHPYRHHSYQAALPTPPPHHPQHHPSPQETAMDLRKPVHGHPMVMIQGRWEAQVRVKHEARDEECYNHVVNPLRDWPQSVPVPEGVHRHGNSPFPTPSPSDTDVSTDTGYNSSAGHPANTDSHVAKLSSSWPKSRENSPRFPRPASTGSTGSVQSLTEDEVYISYNFPENYWLRPSVPEGSYSLSDSPRKLVNDVIDVYLQFMNSFLQEDELSRTLKQRRDDVENLKTSELWELIKARITKGTLDVLRFIKSLPGFSDVHPEDQYLICRLGVFQCSTLMAAINLYDPHTNNFIRNFYEHPVPLDELNELRANLRDYAKALHALRLDTVESALLCCLVVMASDWPSLKSPQAIEEVREQILCAFVAYIDVKCGKTSTRIEDLFSYVPRLRKLGMWHYKLSFEMFLDEQLH